MTDEIHDLSRVDAYAAARRRAMVMHSAWRPMLAGATGAALVIAAVWVTLPRFSYREIEIPKVTMKDVTVDHVVPRDVEVDHVVPKDVEIPVPKDVESPRAEIHAFADVKGKQIVGIITKAEPQEICFDHPPGNCTWPALIDAQGRAILDAHGDPQSDPNVVFIDMAKWVGHEAWSAPSPTDPGHLLYFWVRDGETLTRFTMTKRNDRPI
jgi:hypothetical protein